MDDLILNNPAYERELRAPWQDGSWRWWLFPIFWVVVFVVALVMSALSVGEQHPEQLQGREGVILVVLLLCTIVMHSTLSWGWLYRSQPILLWRGVLIFSLQLALLMLLIWRYGSAFAWISLALFYPIVGGLRWPVLALPLALLIACFVVGSMQSASAATVSTWLLFGIAIQIVVHLGIAFALRIMSWQSDRLRTALAELRAAHTALAASTAQQEELAVLRERTRLARVMHDNLGHALVVMNIKLEAAQLLYERDKTRGAAELEATRTLIRETMGDLRLTLSDLRAPSTEHSDLAAAIERLGRDLQQRSGINVVYEHASCLADLAAEVRETLWYVAREALMNVERHARASCVRIELGCEGDALILRIHDNGKGIDSRDLHRPEHYGVVGMRERMRGIGGTLHIDPISSGGTLVTAFLPLYAAREGATHD